MDAKQILIEGKKVAYWTEGSHYRTKTIFLHGFRGNHKGLLELAKRTNNTNVIIPDLPGYGESQKMDVKHNFDNYAKFFAKFCAALKIEKCNLIGHSFGASIALVIAANYPDLIEKAVFITPVTDSSNFEITLTKIYYRTARHLPKSIRERLVKSRIIDLCSNLLVLKGPQKKKWELIRDGQKTLKTLDEAIILENFFWLLLY